MNERREESKGNVQLSWTLDETVEEVVCESSEVKHQPRKRVIRNQKDAVMLFQELLGDLGRECFV